MREEILNKLLKAQKNEITEYYVYRKLAKRAKNLNARNVLERLADEELSHYEVIKELTGRDVKPSSTKVLTFSIMAYLFGLTFTLKLMERGEEFAQEMYDEIGREYARFKEIMKGEREHELALIDLIDEEMLKYAGSIVLGLNDALVELTGALAGLTLALNNTSLIAIVGMITGIAAALSMAASEYLSTKQEGGRNPLKASIYTGIAYILTVAILVSPYFIFSNVFVCLAFVLLLSVGVVILFTFYISVAQGFSFWKRFLEMAGISLSIAIINFFIGLAIKYTFGVEV